jgi:predicted nucleic acid-binding protein
MIKKNAGSPRNQASTVFLHLAMVSNADVLVSGDADLTDLSGAYRVVSAATLRKRLEAGA